MIIVSQDKTFMLNFDNIESIEIGNFEENRGKAIIYARLTSDYFYTIGEYNTIERAKEVLQEIIEFLDRKSLVEMDEDGITMQVLGNIYRMPKE